MTTLTGEKLYDNQCLDLDAPKREHIHLEIEIGSTSAGIHCGPEVHVGPGTDRVVIFRANKSCILKFKNYDVFGKFEQALEANTFVAVPVVNEIEKDAKDGKVETECAVLPDNTWQLREPQHTPPRIVVP